MRKIQIDVLFSMTGLLTLLIGVIFFRSTFNLTLHDTYIEISQIHIASALCTMFLFFSLLYFIFKKANKPLYPTLGLIHYFLTILPLITVYILSRLPIRTRVYTNFSEEMESMEKLNIIFSITIILCLLGQLLFITNIIVALFRKNASKQ